MNLYTHLDHVELRPGMYLSPPRFASLVAFLDGYEFALTFNHISGNEDPPFRRFPEYVAKEFGVSDGPPSLDSRVIDFTNRRTWPELILQRFPDDDSALLCFFNLLRRYRSSSPLTASS